MTTMSPRMPSAFASRSARKESRRAVGVARPRGSVASEVKTRCRPSSLMSGSYDVPSGSPAGPARGTSCRGACRARRCSCDPRCRPSATRFVAVLVNATYRPSALATGSLLGAVRLRRRRARRRGRSRAPARPRTGRPDPAAADRHEHVGDAVRVAGDEIGGGRGEEDALAVGVRYGSVDWPGPCATREPLRSVGQRDGGGGGRGDRGRHRPRTPPRRWPRRRRSRSGARGCARRCRRRGAGHPRRRQDHGEGADSEPTP